MVEVRMLYLETPSQFPMLTQVHSGVRARCNQMVSVFAEWHLPSLSIQNAGGSCGYRPARVRAHDDWGVFVEHVIAGGKSSEREAATHVLGGASH